MMLSTVNISFEFRHKDIVIDRIKVFLDLLFLSLLSFKYYNKFPSM